MSDGTTLSGGAISVHCPHCGFHHTFAYPPVLRSEPCGGCNYWVCESEWRAAMLKRVDASYARAIERAREIER